MPIDIKEQFNTIEENLSKKTDEKINSFSESVDEKIQSKVEEKVSSLTDTNEIIKEENEKLKEKMNALEAQIQEIFSDKKAPAFHQNSKASVMEDVNRRACEKMKEVIKTKNDNIEIDLFADLDERLAYQKEATFSAGVNPSALGGHTDFEPITGFKRFMGNPLRKVATVTSSGDSSYQFHKFNGNPRVGFGYTTQTSPDNTDMQERSWRKDFVRMSALVSMTEDQLMDINGLQAQVLDTFQNAFDKTEAISMYYNNPGEARLESDARNTKVPFTDGTGVNAFRSNVDYTPDTYGSGSGLRYATGGTLGFESLGWFTGSTPFVANARTIYRGQFNATPTNQGSLTIRQIDTATEATSTSVSLTDEDLLSAMNALNYQYQDNAVWMMSPDTKAHIRSIKSPTTGDGQPFWTDTFTKDGVIMELFGKPIIDNPYMHCLRVNTGGTPPAQSWFPVVYGDFASAYKIVDRYQVTIRLYKENIVDSTVFFAKKRAVASVVDPDAIIKIRTTDDADLGSGQYRY